MESVTTEIKLSLLQEVRKATQDEVAKKNDAAKLNFPKIVEKIKEAASEGFSKAIISVTEMNEYDKKLLVSEGFTVNLRDIAKDYSHPIQFMQQRTDYSAPTKEWVISW